MEPHAWLNWTRDGRGLIGIDRSWRRVQHFDLASRRWTTLVDLESQSPGGRGYLGWMGLGPGDSPLVVRDQSMRDFYALDWEAQ
jgi:hypothetical protein